MRLKQLRDAQKIFDQIERLKIMIRQCDKTEGVGQETKYFSEKVMKPHLKQELLKLERHFLEM